MVFRVIPRALVVLALGALLQTTGCRSSTDRMRVLEAEKAESERRNQMLKQKEAEMRAQMVKAEGDAESERAKAEALEARLALANNRSASSGEASTVDVGSLKSRFAGTGVEVIEREGGGAILVIASDITFQAGRADLNRKAEETLGKVVRTLKETGGFRTIRVEGHTDSDPIKKSGFKSNDELSLARANSVQHFLVAQGIDEGIIEVAGCGDDQPAASNATPAGKAKNRRVEIVLVGGE
jgi:flagellar motor protein MotB